MKFILWKCLTLSNSCKRSLYRLT